MKVIPQMCHARMYLMKVIPQMCHARMYLMKVIPQMCHAPDEGYSTNVSCT